MGILTIAKIIKIQRYVDHLIHQFQRSYVLTANGCDIDDNHFPVSFISGKANSYGNLINRIFMAISARMFDYFDNGVMEELQHRLLHTVNITNGLSEAITFKGRSIGRRVTATGSAELLITWTPSDM